MSILYNERNVYAVDGLSVNDMMSLHAVLRQITVTALENPSALEYGICYHSSLKLRTAPYMVPYLRAEEVTYDFIEEYVGRAAPIPNYERNRQAGTLWAGDQLEARLELLQCLMSTLRACI